MKLAAILGALGRALPILVSARIVALAILPLLIAAVVWAAIAIAAWHPLIDALAAFFGARPDHGSPVARIAARRQLHGQCAQCATLALLIFVPLWLLSLALLVLPPLYAGIAFTELCLAELARLRAGGAGAAAPA